MSTLCRATRPLAFGNAEAGFQTCKWTRGAPEPRLHELVSQRILAMLSALPAFAALLLATATWGSLFHVAKPLLPSLDPLWFTVIRYAAATLCLALVLAFRKRTPWAALLSNAPRFALLGFLGYG